MRVELGSPPEANPAPARQHGQGRAGGLTGVNDAVITTRALQRELESRGYLIGANDGVAGLVTRAAIMAYEYDHGIALTGEPTERLLQAVILGTATSDAPASANQPVGPYAEQVIRTTQQSLSGLGYGPIKADGFMGDTTVGAIRRFEHQQGLPETGRISGVLVARLAKFAALGQVQSGR